MKKDQCSIDICLDWEPAWGDSGNPPRLDMISGTRSDCAASNTVIAMHTHVAVSLLTSMCLFDTSEASS